MSDKDTLSFYQTVFVLAIAPLDQDGKRAAFYEQGAIDPFGVRRWDDSFHLDRPAVQNPKGSFLFRLPLWDCWCVGAGECECRPA